MTIKQTIAIIKRRDAIELFEHAVKAVMQCEEILHRMQTIKFSAEKRGTKADVRAAEKEIKSYTEKLEKLNIDALMSAHEVMSCAAITAEFGDKLDSFIADKVQAVINRAE